MASIMKDFSPRGRSHARIGTKYRCERLIIQISGYIHEEYFMGRSVFGPVT